MISCVDGGVEKQTWLQQKLELNCIIHPETQCTHQLYRTTTGWATNSITLFERFIIFKAHNRRKNCPFS